MESLVSRIHYWSKHFPNKVAIDDGRAALTYAELAEKSNHLAFTMQKQGIVKDDVVAIVLPKDCDAVCAILATMMVGAVYVPVDKNAPIERQLAIFRDCKPSLIILSGEVNTAFNEYSQVDIHSVDNLMTGSGKLDETCVESLCYILYTSGSTGKPNGVAISHQSVLSFFAAVNNFMGITHQSRCMNTSALYFDVSVVDLLLPLYQGATVFLGPESPMPIRFVSILAKQDITHFCAVGSTLTLIASLPGFESREFPSLQCIMTGAEVLSHQTMKSWLSSASDIKILNGYGPTEATCVCTVFEINKNNIDEYENFPIGIPLPGIAVCLDNDSEADAEGELCVAGEQVMQGYIERPALNQEKFFYKDNQRFYRTGDIAQYDESGNLVFLRRKDYQVKVRGYRIHLEDVARPYRNLEGVTDAFAVPIDHSKHGQCLVIAIAVNSQLDPLDALLLKGAEKLPSYMRPKLIGQVDSLPTKPSGKADVSAIHSKVNAYFSDIHTNDDFLVKVSSC
ncbi:MAG: amino acid adenylation domain-containing protein [Cellvibrionales bacterium]|nr:amino acid adenylation domain-containing protein [Cellvibrionales bacterium]